MELMVRDGDYLPDGAGGFRRAEGAEELLQRVLWKLSIPRGSFPLLPGSMWPRPWRTRESSPSPAWSWGTGAPCGYIWSGTARLWP